MFSWASWQCRKRHYHPKNVKRHCFTWDRTFGTLYTGEWLDWKYNSWEFDENQRIIYRQEPRKVTVKIAEDETDCIEEVRDNAQTQRNFTFRIDELNYVIFLVEGLGKVSKF